MTLPKENLEHPCFVQPGDPAIPVWRYIDLPKLISLILRRQLPLTRLDTLPDKFEGLRGRNFRAAAREQLRNSSTVPPAGKSLDEFAE